jgi:hypothetical protein
VKMATSPSRSNTISKASSPRSAASVHLGETSTGWRIAIHGQGVEVTARIRRLVDGTLRALLEPYGCRVVFAHVRLWASSDRAGSTTCYVRVDLNPSGGLALGATAPTLAEAVKRASERVEAAVGSQLACQGIEPRRSFSWPGAKVALATASKGLIPVSGRMTDCEEDT